MAIQVRLFNRFSTIDVLSVKIIYLTYKSDEDSVFSIQIPIRRATKFLDDTISLRLTSS